MRTLPEDLGRWAPPLSAFSDELALMMLPWVRRIDGVVGACGASDAAHMGEPDGYGGIDKRGPYNRLLSSQWLLADLYPDEFLRRAVMGEHVFFRLAHRSPQADRATVVLLDAGPDQWGAPRLAQLAALVVLLQRAQSRGARLYWGILQAATPRLSEGLGRAEIKDLLGARSARRVTADDGERWRVSLADLDERVDGWLLGPPRLEQCGALRAFPQLGFEPPLFAETEHIEVTWRAADSTRARRGTSLPLPQQSLAVRLLRDPFLEAHSPVIAAPTLSAAGMQLASDGRTLTLCTASGGVVSYPVPNSPNASPGRPRMFTPPPGHRVLAATRVGKRFIAVTLCGHELMFIGIGEEPLTSGHVGMRRSVSPQVIESLALDTQPGGEPLGRLETFRNDNGVGLIMKPASGVLLTLMPKKGGDYRIRSGPVAPVLARGVQGKGVVTARFKHGVLAVHEHLGGTLLTVGGLGETPPALFVGHGAFAVDMGEDNYRVVSNDGSSRSYRVPGGHNMVGTLGGGLVLIEPDKRQLVLLTRETSKRLLRAPARLTAVQVACAAPVVACTDEQGGVTVLSTAHAAPLLQLRAATPERAP